MPDVDLLHSRCQSAPEQRPLALESPAPCTGGCPGPGLPGLLLLHPSTSQWPRSSGWSVSPSGSLGFLNPHIPQSCSSARTKHIHWKGGKWPGGGPALCSENPPPPSQGSWPHRSVLQESSAEQQRRSACVSDTVCNSCLFVF